MSKIKKNIALIFEDEKKSKELLESYNLLFDYIGAINNELRRTIETAIKPPIYQEENLEWENEENEKNAYVFKLIDNSIIYYYVCFDNKGEVKQYNCSYISGSFNDDDYDNMINYLNKDDESKITESKNDDNVIKETLLNRYLTTKKVAEEVQLSIKEVSNNPIIIRIDRDSSNCSFVHPENHLTINNIENSRFKVNNDICILNFIVFILDLIYGIKQENFNQFLTI